LLYGKVDPRACGAAQGLEYEHLSLGIKDYINRKGDDAISAQSLALMTADVLRDMLGWTRELPLEDERVRLLREVRLCASDEGVANCCLEAYARACIQFCLHVQKEVAYYSCWAELFRVLSKSSDCTLVAHRTTR
jgi:hypothetical protein